jgi:hypothetical protein
MRNNVLVGPKVVAYQYRGLGFAFAAVLAYRAGRQNGNPGYVHLDVQ